MDLNTEISAIEKLIFSFGDSFNSSDISSVVSAFMPDGVLMPNNGPLVKGHEPIKALYESLFKVFKINITYTINDIVINGDYAFARTNSRVETLIRATDESVSLLNKELFVIKKDNAQWKIADYIFNNTSKN